MEATITVTIELPVNFVIVSNRIEDIQIDEDQTIDLVNAELSTKESEDALMAEAEETGQEWEADRAEFLFNEKE